MFDAEVSQEQIISECNIEVVSLNAVYIKDPAVLNVQVLWNEEAVGVEDYVKMYYREQGYECIDVESVPFHVLFGIFLWLVIQDPTDERVQIVGFGDRVAFDNGENGKTILCHKPDDFGSSAYGKRRKKEIDHHFTKVLSPEELDWLFELWIEPSERLRQYLWAHQDSDVKTAKLLTTILPYEVLLRILRYLVDSYWERYVGWPDLLVYRDNEFFFAEVKSSKDKLSNNQKRWIRDNNERLNLPFKLIKIHKSNVIETNK